MRLEVYRYASNSDATLSRVYIDGRFVCHGLEDEYRSDKVPGETRIPAGTYEMTMRTVGGFHGRYRRMFGAFHKGMLWVRGVPGFEYILWHIGNYDRDTDGCLLLGKADQKAWAVWSSKATYKRVYAEIIKAFERGESVTVEYVDGDR